MEYSEKTLSLQFQGFGDLAMLDAYEDAIGDLARNQERVDHLQQEIFRRIGERGGTTLPNADENGEQIWTCEQQQTYGPYNQGKLTPLLEIFNATELDQCWSAGHNITEPVWVPAKWDTVKLKAVARKHSAEAVTLVEAAKVPTGRRLKFERIKPEDQGPLTPLQ